MGEEAMSDHLDSPGPITITKGDDSVLIGPPLGDAKTDITDLYAFLKPDPEGLSAQAEDDDGVAGKSILMLNVNPLAPALANEFESGAEYLIRADTDKNVFAIVLAVPNRALGRTPATTSLWGRTRIVQDGALINDDRVGRAAINTVFNHGVDMNIFNNLEPGQDSSAMNSEGMTFVQSFADTLTALGGSPSLATVLLPDVLNYDYTKPTDYAKLNGRRLQDDVISISLSLVTNGGLTTDNVGPHSDYLDRFPYAGKPH